MAAALLCACYLPMQKVQFVLCKLVGGVCEHAFPVSASPCPTFLPISLSLWFTHIHYSHAQTYSRFDRVTGETALVDCSFAHRRVVTQFWL